MKKLTTILMIAILVIPMSLLGGKRNNSPIVDYVKNLPREKLSSAEKRDLLYMRQEEKLARDVYQALGEKWNLPIFKNISRSEQQHMDILKTLVEKYGLKDPLKGIEDTRGKFKDKKFEKLYKQLVAEGEKSLTAALTVGATIEDLDIKDLEEALTRTDNKDIRTAYLNLMKGSRNHMRSFVAFLKKYGGDYKPQYISKEEFEKILSTPHERGMIYPDKGSRNDLMKISGTVKEVVTAPGLRNKRISWWVAIVETDKGEVKLRIDPTWRTSSIPLKVGDKISATAFVPPYWQTRGGNEALVCTLQTPKGSITYRNCNPTASRKLRGNVRSRVTTLTGKVIAVEQKPGIRRQNIRWWVIKVKTEDATEVEVRVAPLFKLGDLNISKGDKVKVKWYMPPAWRQGGVMACEIEDITTGKTLELRRCPGVRR